jgi:hypothetical protein
LFLENFLKKGVHKFDAFQKAILGQRANKFETDSEILTRIKNVSQSEGIDKVFWDKVIWKYQ